MENKESTSGGQDVTFFDTLIADNGEEIHRLETIESRLTNVLERLRGAVPADASSPDAAVEPTAISDKVRFLGQRKQSIACSIQALLTELETYI